MAGFKGRHKNEKVIIVANGPGLREVPTDYLNSAVTFSSNYISLREDFYPTYLIVIDELAFEGEERMSLIQPRIHTVENAFLLHTQVDKFPHKNIVPIHNMRAACWSWSPLRFLFTGGTSTYVALQLALYMGASEVELVGLDHDYSGQLHFHEDYLTTEKAEKPEEHKTLEIMEQSYAMALRAYNLKEVPISNVSIYSQCKTFVRAVPPWLVGGETIVEEESKDE